MVSIIFSSSDLSVPITELVRMVKLYSTPWETKSAALKKLHEDYEKWVIWFLFQLPSFLLPNVRVKAAFMSFVWLGAAFIGNFASIVNENYINMTLILLFFFPISTLTANKGSLTWLYRNSYSLGFRYMNGAFLTCAFRMNYSVV